MQIYADNAATTKMSGAAMDVMLETMQNWYGNPSSLYAIGQRAKEKLEEAREEIAKIINADAREIIFTSGGSESDNQALLTAAMIGRKKGKKHIISSAFEHHAIRSRGGYRKTRRAGSGDPRGHLPCHDHDREQ